jgi:hypothetical protein
LFGRVWNVLLVIALVAMLGLGWLGVEASTVRHRRAMIEKIEAAGGGFDGTYSSLPPLLARPAVVPHPHDGTRHPLSTVRRMLGDHPIGNVYFFRPLTAEDREYIEALPEADFWAFPTSPAAPSAP